MEALWMGVPVVSLVGDRTASRYGLSLLAAVGLESLAAVTPESYVQVAQALASDLDALSRLRQQLRARVAASALCDAEGFARSVEETYRQMWRNHCEEVFGPAIRLERE
jgi:predicted O-linked N-acetylglucosamine transferase (SPINDLY family)